MKKLEAIIKPFKLDDVKNAVNELGISGMTISEVKGLGGHNGHAGFARTEPAAAFLPKLKIEVVVADPLVERAVQAIQQAARTDKTGDGKIFVLNIDEAVRIRTGERGAAAV